MSLRRSSLLAGGGVHEGDCVLDACDGVVDVTDGRVKEEGRVCWITGELCEEEGGVCGTIGDMGRVGRAGGGLGEGFDMGRTAVCGSRGRADPADRCLFCCDVMRARGNCWRCTSEC